MEKKKILSLIEETKNPTRVIVGVFNDNLYAIFSRENKNDTLGWFHINSAMLEEAFMDLNLSWCYVIETVPKQPPFIYMYVGEGLTKDYVIDENRIAVAMLPEDREVFFEKKPFSLIDIDKYNNGITEIEKEARKIASDVFVVYEA